MGSQRISIFTAAGAFSPPPVPVWRRDSLGTGALVPPAGHEVVPHLSRLFYLSERRPLSERSGKRVVEQRSRASLG